MNEDKAARYHRLKRHCGVLSVALSALVLGGLLLSGASLALANVSASIFPDRSVGFHPAAVAIYVAAIALVHEAVTFPLTFYSGFLLERRYELSTAPFTAWLRDHAKAAGLGLVLGIAGAQVVYFALSVSPDWWWLASSLVFVGVLAVMARIAPTVLLPLFYTFTPLDRESLRARLVSLSQRAGVPVLGVYEWGLGEKTRRANAALVGTGATRRIIVSDTLLAGYSEDEIAVILAHELGHHVHRDMLKALAVESALLLASFYVAGAALSAWWAPLGLHSPGDVAGLPLLLLAAGSTSLAATPIANALSRRNERRADRYAFTLTGEPDAFISGMKRLAAQNLAEARPSRLAVWLFHTHPPIEQRIEEARHFRLRIED